MSGPPTLLDAVVAISADLDLPGVLTRIVEAATNLTGAQYGSLAVVGEGGDLVEFITTPLRLKDLGTSQPAGLRAHHPPMVTFLGVPIRTRGTVFGNLHLAGKQGGAPFTQHDEELVQALAGAAGVIIENARAYGLSELRRQWLEEGAELTDALQPPIDLGAALRRVTAAAQRVVRAFGVAVLQFPADEEPVISAPQGLAVEALEPLLPDFAALAGQPGAGTFTAELTTQELTVVLVPLRTHTVESGILVALFERRDRRLSVEERQLFAEYAEHAGLTLDRAQAFADRERLAVATERNRIARDLHDVVIQRLFAAGMRLRALTDLSSHEQLAAAVGAALEDLDLTIKDVRTTIFALQG